MRTFHTDPEAVERRRTALVLTMRGAESQGDLADCIAKLSRSTGIDVRMLQRIWAAGAPMRHPSSR